MFGIEGEFMSRSLILSWEAIFVTIICLVLIISGIYSLCSGKYKKKSIFKLTELGERKEYKSRVIIVCISIAFGALGLIVTTIPLIQDSHYLISGNYAKMTGVIVELIEDDKRDGVVIIEDDVTKELIRLTKDPTYFTVGDFVYVEYLPHLKEGYIKIIKEENIIDE